MPFSGALACYLEFVAYVTRMIVIAQDEFAASSLPLSSQLATQVHEALKSNRFARRILLTALCITTLGMTSPHEDAESRAPQ